MMLHDDDPTVQRFGAVATANVCNTTPEAVTGLVDAVIDAYSNLQHGSEQISIIRSLGIIGDETNTALDQYDSWFADILRSGNGIVPAETAENIGNIVVKTPQEYPKMTQAVVAVLGETGQETQSHAMIAVALIA